MICFFVDLKHCCFFLLCILWVAKYSCISVWNDFETFTENFRCSFTIMEVHSPGWLISSQRHLIAPKNHLGNELRGRNAVICFNTCKCNFKSPDVAVMFDLTECAHRARGGDIRGVFGWPLLDCNVHCRPRGSADATQEKKGRSWKI